MRALRCTQSNIFYACSCIWDKPRTEDTHTCRFILTCQSTRVLDPRQFFQCHRTEQVRTPSAQQGPWGNPILSKALGSIHLNSSWISEATLNFASLRICLLWKVDWVGVTLIWHADVQTLDLPVISTHGGKPCAPLCVQWIKWKGHGVVPVKRKKSIVLQFTWHQKQFSNLTQVVQIVTGNCMAWGEGGRCVRICTGCEVWAHPCSVLDVCLLMLLVYVFAPKHVCRTFDETRHAGC